MAELRSVPVRACHSTTAPFSVGRGGEFPGLTPTEPRRPTLLKKISPRDSFPSEGRTLYDDIRFDWCRSLLVIVLAVSEGIEPSADLFSVIVSVA